MIFKLANNVYLILVTKSLIWEPYSSSWDFQNGDWPGPSYFVSGRKYFPSPIVLNETGDVTLHPQTWEFFPDITDHYRTQ